MRNDTLFTNYKCIFSKFIALIRYCVILNFMQGDNGKCLQKDVMLKKIAFQDAALIGQGQMCKWM